MRFGSVEFFKVLIKTALVIFFFVPLIIAVVFGVFLVNKNAQIKQLEERNLALDEIANVLIKSHAGTIEDFYGIFDKSELSYEEFIELVNEKKNIDAKSFYEILSKTGISDADIVSMAASKKTVDGDKFYEIMSANGITDKALLSAVINKNGSSPEKLRELLKQCGLSDAEIAGIAGKTPVSNPPVSTPITPGTEDPNISDPGVSEPEKSPYADLYTDMYVSAPTSYVREQGTIYLTFDDGPSQYTSDILYTLRQRDVKATFFVVPSRRADCTQTLKAIVADGHAIGVHSESHKYTQIYASVEAYLADFYEAWDMIRDATGVETQIFRFPGGSKNDYNAETRDAIIAEMTRRGFRYYDWNVQSNDISGATWTQMYNSIPKDVKDQYRSIVLFHDTSYGADEVLDDVIKVLKGEGYKFDKINNDTKPYQFIGPFS